MSGTENREPVVFTISEGQPLIATQGNLHVAFSSATGAGLTVNGQEYVLEDGVLVPSSHVANDRPIDGAPAILWHRTNGRLTKNDIAKTICDAKDNPIGIYMGVWAPDWAKGREIRTYDAITDARDGNDPRLYRSFNRYVEYLNNRQGRQNPYENGEKLLDRPANTPRVTYEMAMQAHILALKPGEFTGQMIKPYILLRGQEYPGQEVKHSNNSYDLRHTGDFAKANNGGFDSRFVTEADSDNARWYVSSTEYHHKVLVCTTNFTSGGSDWGHKDNDVGSLRPFVAELPQP